MSALPDQAVFGISPGDPLTVTATLWRGAMIERYARIEFFVDRSLQACAAAGIVDGARLHEHLPQRRLDALIAALADARLAGKSEGALGLLSVVREGWGVRNALCHGRLRFTKAGARIEWTCHSKGRREPRFESYSLSRMLESLVAIDEIQRKLGCLLGCIDKACSNQFAA